jgi:hypothetical protein
MGCQYLFVITVNVISEFDCILNLLGFNSYFIIKLCCFLMFFVGLPHLATYIFLIFSMNEPELGAGINPGMAFKPFPSSILDKTR